MLRDGGAEGISFDAFVGAVAGATVTFDVAGATVTFDVAGANVTFDVAGTVVAFDIGAVAATGAATGAPTTATVVGEGVVGFSNAGITCGVTGAAVGSVCDAAEGVPVVEAIVDGGNVPVKTTVMVGYDVGDVVGFDSFCLKEDSAKLNKTIG